MTKYLSTVLSAGLGLLTVLTVSTLTACTVVQQKTQQGAIETVQSSSQWQEIGTLPTSLESHQMIVLGEYVYVLGGWNETEGVHAEVFFTAFNPEQGPDHRLDDWQETTAALPLKLQHHAVLTHQGSIYVLGGDNGFWDGSTVSDRIFRAIPNEQGDITEWTEVGQLPEPLTIHAVTLIDNQIYIFGGSHTFRPGDTEVVDSVFSATLSDDGTIAEFQRLPPFPTPIGWMTATEIDNRIFAISGKTQFSPTQLAETVWTADIQADNQLSTFEPIGDTIGRQRHATVKIDKMLVVIAGGGATGVLSTVEAAEVDAQGNLTPWQELSPLPETLYAHAAFAHNDNIYVSGGFLRYGSNDTSRKIFRLSQ